MRTTTAIALGAGLLLGMPGEPAWAQESTRPLSAEEALVLFSANSLDMRIARARLRATLGDARQGRALPNPSLIATNEDLGAYAERYFNVNQPIDFVWEQSPRSDRAEAAVAAGGAAFAVDSAIAVLTLRHAYADAWAAREAFAALEAAAQVVSAVVEDAAIRVDDGDLARYDLRRLGVARGTLQRRLAQAGLRLADSERLLGSMVLADDGVSRARPVELGPVAEPPTAAVAVELARARRPELERARRDVEVRRASTKLAGRQWLSGTAVTGGYKSQSDGRDGLFLGLQVPVPLLDRRGGAVDAARARLEGAESEVTLLERLVAREATLAAERLTAARAFRLSLGTDGGIEATALIESARIAYEEGEVGVVELVDAAEAFVEARLLEADARRDEWVAWYELEYAVGGMSADAEPGALR